MNNKWAQAITNGDFEDDDAQMVKGIDTMDDGNMARRRRQQAAQTAFQHVQSNYSASSLPRDQNGQVPPRSRFPGNRREGKFMVGQTHPGSDEPIDIHATFTAAMRRQPPRVRPPSALTTSAAWTSPQLTQPSLPKSSSILAQLPVSIQSAALPERSQRYQGRVLLILGSNYDGGMIIFVLDKAEIEDIRYSITEYHNRTDVSNQALMLQFAVKGKPVFFAVDFGRADGKRSFDQFLQKLVDRFKQKKVAPENPMPKKDNRPTKAAVPSLPISPPTTVASPETAPASKAATPHVIAVSCDGTAPAHVSKTNQTNEVAPLGNSTRESKKHPTRKIEAAHASVGNTGPLQIASPDLSPQLTETQLQEIVNRVIDTATYIRDCLPDNYSLDTMKAIISGTTASFMMKQNPGFAKLSPRERAQLVEGHWSPAVKDRFVTWLKSVAGEEAQKKGQEECVKSQELNYSKVCRVYSKVELMALKSAAIGMTDKLRSSSFFQESKSSTRRQPTVETQHDAHDRSALLSTDSTRPAPKANAANHLIVPTVHSAQVACLDDDGSGVADWLFGPKTEPTKNIGLNSSVHNLANSDVLGTVSGQFTGAFIQTPEFQDLVEIFDKADQCVDEISPLTHDFGQLSLR